MFAFLLLLLGLIPTTAPLASASGTMPCAPLVFFGVRGSGETETDHSGFGRTVAAVDSEVVARVPGTLSYEITYPAIPMPYNAKSFLQYLPQYNASVKAGTSTLLAEVREQIASCPDAQIVLAGYSQGAQVVGDAWMDHMSASEKGHIVGVALLGDPKFKGAQTAVNVGDYVKSMNGIWDSMPLESPRTVPAALVPKIRSYCLANDPICNFSVSNALFCKSAPSSCPHVHYPDWYYQGKKYTTSAGDFLASRWSPTPAMIAITPAAPMPVGIVLDLKSISPCPAGSDTVGVLNPTHPARVQYAVLDPTGGWSMNLDPSFDFETQDGSTLQLLATCYGINLTPTRVYPVLSYVMQPQLTESLSVTALDSSTNTLTATPDKPCPVPSDHVYVQFSIQGPDYTGAYATSPVSPTGDWTASVGMPVLSDGDFYAAAAFCMVGPSDNNSIETYQYAAGLS